jgi:cytoskeletal protein RodZ
MKSLVGVLILMISLTGVYAIAQQDQPQAQPQTQPSTSPSASPAASPSQSPSAADQASQSQMGQQAQTFMGKISKENGSLVLKDKASNTSYKLDNEEQAKQFEGKDVKVTGTLDPATNTVHVTNIEIASKQ